MGHEYNINFEIRDRKEIESLLEALPSFESIHVNNNRNVFSYRLPGNKGEIPNAFAEVESNSIYFCDNNGSYKLLENLILKITNIYGNPEVIDHSE